MESLTSIRRVSRLAPVDWQREDIPGREHSLSRDTEVCT